MPDNKQMKIQWITINGRQVPLVLPQTYSYADDDWKITSDQDPLPVVEYGTTENGVIVPKRVSDEGYELTQLTGSKVEEVVIVDALAITDNTTRFFTFNAEKYTSFYIYVINSLDSPVNITPYEYHNLVVDIWDSSTETFKSVASMQKSIPANRAVPLMDTPGFKRLKGQGAKSLRIRVKPDESPTAGSLSIIAWGVVI